MKFAYIILGPLIYEKTISTKSTTYSFNNVLSVGSQQSNTHEIYALTCPNNDNYKLVPYNNLKYNNINIDEEILSYIVADLKYKINFSGVIQDKNTNSYVVDYGLGTRLKSDKLRLIKKPSPSSHVLDNILMYMCASIKNGNDISEILFAMVSQNGNILNRNRAKYSIVWYERLN